MVPDEPEWQTRKTRIDAWLADWGWKVVPYDPARPRSAYDKHAVEEFATDNGPADHALFVAGRILGIVEAKKVSLGPQNVLNQAERYSRGATDNPFDFHGLHAPFLYSTNGEILWFHDIRHPLNRSRPIAKFHTPAALVELHGRDIDVVCGWFAVNANKHPLLRPYQIDAIASVERANADRKRQMLVAMATGTGKTITWEYPLSSTTSYCQRSTS